jgi:ActR/RegA family two-component response regulator
MEATISQDKVDHDHIQEQRRLRDVMRWPLRYRRADRGPTGTLLLGGKYLIIEDEEEHQQLLIDEVEEEGGAAYTARTVYAAVRWARRVSFDGAILDEGLPDGTGTEVIYALLEEGISLPIVSVSGVAKAIDGFRLKSLGVYQFLDKPIVKGKVAWAIHQATTAGAKTHYEDNRFSTTFYKTHLLKEVVNEILPHIRRLPPDIQRQIYDGREALIRGYDVRRISAFARFLKHPTTVTAFEHLGIGVTVRLLEDLSNWQ